MFLCFNLCCTGQRKIANNTSDDSTNEVRELRAELASANDKIATMDGELTQLKVIMSGRKL